MTSYGTCFAKPMDEFGLKDDHCEDIRQMKCVAHE